MGASQAACCASERKGEHEGSSLNERQVEKEQSTRAMCGCLSDRKGQESTAAGIRSREVPIGSGAGSVAAKLAALEASNRELHEAKLELEARLNVLGDENERLREEVVSVSGFESNDGQRLSTNKDLLGERPRGTSSSKDPFSFPSPRLESSSCRAHQAISDARGSKRVVRFDDAADVSPMSSLSHSIALGLERSSVDDGSSRRRSSAFSTCSAQSEWWEDEGRRVSSVPTWLKLDEPVSPRGSSASGGAANMKRGSSNAELSSPPSSRSPRTSSLPTALSCPPAADTNDEY